MGIRVKAGQLWKKKPIYEVVEFCDPGSVFIFYDALADRLLILDTIGYVRTIDESGVMEIYAERFIRENYDNADDIV